MGKGGKAGAAPERPFFPATQLGERRTRNRRFPEAGARTRLSLHMKEPRLPNGALFVRDVGRPAPGVGFRSTHAIRRASILRGCIEYRLLLRGRHSHSRKGWART